VINRSIHVAIACGGTGGHLFPGVAVGRALVRRGVRVTLLISPKEVDREAVRGVEGMTVAVLSAVGLQGRNHLAFGWAFLRSLVLARSLFRRDPPASVLAMGGFTSAPPILAGRGCGAVTALHESNAIPGRANRWLSRWVDAAFVGFPETADRWPRRGAEVTGTPVREEFGRCEVTESRVALGLDPGRPVLSILGGSQGATGLNDAVRQALPGLLRQHPGLQFIHLTGARDVDAIRQAYGAVGASARVEAFSSRMDHVLGATTVALARSGASTLAEFAAAGVPSVLMPFPAAVDDHQRLNADVFVRAGAARLLAQREAGAGALEGLIGSMLRSPGELEEMGRCAARMHRPESAERIAERLGSLASGPFGAAPAGTMKAREAVVR